VLIIIAWGFAAGAKHRSVLIILCNAPGAGVYDLKPLSLHIKMGGEGVALGFNKAPFQG